MGEPITELDALREVVESQRRLGHTMTLVPNNVLMGLIARVEAATTADSLDAAWQAAEAVVPRGREIVVGRWPDSETTLRYYVRAAMPGAPVGYGPTPAAALLDIAVRLATDESEGDGR